MSAPGTAWSRLGGDVEAMKAVAEQALESGQAALDVAGAELRLARSSTGPLLIRAALLLLLGLGAWLLLLALAAAGLYRLSGSWWLSFSALLLLTLAGCAALLVGIRRCLRDLSLPRTRRALRQFRGSQP